MFALITENDLLSAIAECQGERNPNANTCIKLAAYYTILENIQDKPSHTAAAPAYSYAAPVQNTAVQYTSDTEFAKIINGKSYDDIMHTVDELMTTLSVLYPGLYDAVIRKINNT